VNLQLLTRPEALPVRLSHAPHLERPQKRSNFALLALDRFEGPPAWQMHADQMLGKLLMLRPGWNGPNTGPISLSMVAFIRAVLSSVMRDDTPAPSFVPAHGGALQLEWHEGGLDIELMVFRPLDAELSVQFHDGREAIEEVQLSTEFDLLSEVLSELA